MKNLHIQLSVTVNADRWASYNSPRGREEIEFTIPFEMFNGTNFEKLCAKAIQGASKSFEEEERKAAEEEKEAERKALLEAAQEYAS